MRADRTTTTVSPLIASSNWVELSCSFSGGSGTFQPARPVVRSICWRWVQRELSEALSFTPTTSLPFADGVGGIPHSGVWSGSFHFSWPSATAYAVKPLRIALTTVSPTRHGPYCEVPAPATSAWLSRSQTRASPARMPALGSYASGPPPGPLPSPWSTEGVPVGPARGSALSPRTVRW